jgi:N-acetylmuramic acid 6-phosphate etherase
VNESGRDVLPPTEGVDEATRGLDALSPDELIATLLRSQRRAFDAASDAGPGLAQAAERIATLLEAGGSLHYCGAGTSGRLGVLDAAECPPTFSTPPGLVRAHIAGGADALVRAVEGAEDDAGAGEREARSAVRAGDAVVGLSASGGAPYVVAFVVAARAAGAFTIALSSRADSPLGTVAELSIALETGAEPLAGSTRLVAGTAQKLALNALSTAVMVRLGKVYDNLMVDVTATNAKLRARALRLVMKLTDCEAAVAQALLERADGSVKVAVVMARLDVDANSACELLARSGGRLRFVLESEV